MKNLIQLIIVFVTFSLLGYSAYYIYNQMINPEVKEKSKSANIVDTRKPKTVNQSINFREVGQKNPLLESPTNSAEAKLVDVEGGNGEGVAVMGLNNTNDFYVYAEFKNLPKLTGNEFYEGWIVDKPNGTVISTGKAKEEDGIFSNVHKNVNDLTSFTDYVLTREKIEDGKPEDHVDACGFAWTRIIADGRSKLGRIVAKSEYFRKYHTGGFYMWTKGVAGPPQSMGVKEYWQDVIAKGLTEKGFKAYAESRMD